MAFTPEQESAAKALLAKGDALGKAASAQTGIAYNPQYTPAPQTPTAISSTNLQPPAPLNVPPYQPPQQTVPDINTLLTQYNAPSAEQTQGQNEQNSILSKIESTINKQGQQGARQSELETQLGVPDLNKNLTEIQNQIRSLNAEAFQQVQNQEGRLAPQFAIVGEQERIQRLNSARQYGLAATAQAMQGSLALAQDSVERALKAEFGGLEAQLKHQTMLLDLNREKLAAADKKKTQALEIALNERARQLEQQVNDKKQIYEVVLTAAQNGAPAALLNTAMRGDINSALQSLGQYLQPPTNQQYINGTDNQRAGVFNPKTGTFTPLPGGGAGGGIAGGPVANPAYAQALTTILASGKFTKDQTAAITNAINNGEDPFTVVKNQAKNILGQAGESKLTSYEVAKEQLVNVQDTLQKFYAAGGSTNYLTGNYERVINKLGEVRDPQLVQIATEIAASLQIYRNAVSGTAYSVQEGVDIASIFPGINKTEGLNTAILNGRMKAFDSTIDSTYRSVLGKQYDTLKAAQLAPPNNQTSPTSPQTEPQSMTQISQEAAQYDFETPSSGGNSLYNKFMSWWNS